jgi:hypothetical protein
MRLKPNGFLFSYDAKLRHTQSLRLKNEWVLGGIINLLGLSEWRHTYKKVRQSDLTFNL